MNDTEKAFDFINHYFDKIYILSLKDSVSRHESLKEHMSYVDYEIFWGTDKKELPAQIINDKSFYDDNAHRNTKRTKRSMILGECACADSHRRIYQDIIDNGYQRALIFEDDVVPVLNELRELEHRFTTLPSDWDLILLDYYDHYLPSKTNIFKSNVYSMLHKLNIGGWGQIPLPLIKQRNMREYNEYFWRPGKLSGTHAYAVSSNAAKRYIAYQTPIKLQADRVFYFYHAEHALNDFALKAPAFARGEVANISTIDVPGSK